MVSIKRGYCAYLDDGYWDLIILQDVFRRVVGKTECYFKYDTFNQKKFKKQSEFESHDFSKLSKILDIKTNNFNLLYANNIGSNIGSFYHLSVFKKVDDSCIADYNFYDFVIFLLMDTKMKKELEKKYDLIFMTEEEYDKSIGLKN